MPSPEKAARPACDWSKCVRVKRADGKCFYWCKCLCHGRVIPPGGDHE